MKTMKILFTLVVFVMMGLTVSAQAKKDTTVIFKVGIHCPSCKEIGRASCMERV